jgi:hypothetical protein
MAITGSGEVRCPCGASSLPNAESARSDCGSAAAFRGPDWPVMCVRPADVTKQLRRHQSLASVHYLSPLWVGCISSTRVTDPAQIVGTAAGPAGPGVARLTDDKPSYRPPLPARRPHQVDFLACLWGEVQFRRPLGRSAVDRAASPQESTSAISGRSSATTSAPSCRSCCARWSCVGTKARTGTPRSSSSTVTMRSVARGAGHQHKPAHPSATQRRRRLAHRRCLSQS